MAAPLLRIQIPLLLLALAAIPAARAQDNHYWRQSYGTEATLLNGAVIGRSLDMSAAYYNPSGVATIQEASVLLGAHIYEYTGITVQGTDAFTGLPLDVGNSSLSPAPSFVGGTVPFEFLGRHRVGYSILTRQTAESRMAFRRSVPTDGDLVQAEYLNDNELNELWVGITWACPLSPRVAVGATLFTAVRNQLLRRQATGQVLADDGAVGLASGISEFDYDSWRLVPKLGTTLDFDPLTVGATVTVPSLGLWGSGSALYNSTATGIDFDGDGTDDPQFAADYQEERASDFSSGLAVGLGAAFDVGSTTLFASGEWFQERGPARVVDTEPFTAQGSGDPLTNDLILKNRSVLNVALGIRHAFSDRISGYLSGSTDRASADTSLDVSVGRTPWDLYHVGGGAKLTINRLELVLGGTYSFGDARLPVDDASGLPVIGESTIEVRETGFRLLFGFQFGFGDAAPAAKPAGAPGEPTTP